MRKLTDNIFKAFIGLILICFLFFYFSKPNQSPFHQETKHSSSLKQAKNSCSLEYKNQCIRLFKKLRHPAPNTLYRPPLRAPPPELKAEFEQNGDMPIRKTFYFNDAYADSASDNSKPKELKFEQYDGIELIMNGSKPAGTYGNKMFAPLLAKYKSKIQNRNMVIIGTIYPWLEKYSYYLNASTITTLDYTRANWDNPKLRWEHVNDFLDRAISEEQIEHFDNSASFSSIEHSGLGRYGDPLSPNGDIDAVQETHCLLKPGGLFFLALPFSYAEKGFIEFNAHRFYGESRLRLLFKGWTEVERQDQAQNSHMGFVLRKENTCL